MKSKRLAVILIAVAFSLVVLISCVGLFSVKKVHVDFTVSQNASSERIQEKLDRFVGKNLLFFNVDSVEQALDDEPYIQVLSVEKRYPNVLDVRLKERVEVYSINYDGKTFVLDDNGVVLAEKDCEGQRDIIELSIGEGVAVQGLTLGKVVKTDNPTLLSTVFDMAKSVNLADCIKGIEIEKVDGYVNEFDVVFKSFSGVEICVEDALTNGKEKVANAFKVYDEYLTDYQKTYGSIQSYMQHDGKFEVTYEQKVIDIN